MESIVDSKYFLPASLVTILVLITYNAYLFWPRAADSPVVESVAVDPQVTQLSLGYLVKKTDVAKVMVQDNQVYIGFTSQPEPAVLASLVQEAALNYARAIGRDVFVHGTHEQQMSSIGTPAFSEYCNAHAGASSVLGSEGTLVTQSAIIEGNC